MQITEFSIGLDFYCGQKSWRCTDVGTRVVVAISLEPTRYVSYTAAGEPPQLTGRTEGACADNNWHAGPPYAVAEVVFDEYDLPACSVTRNASD